MNNRSPYSVFQVANGVSGSLMGKTLGYLAILLLIVTATTAVAPGLGAVGTWGGFLAAIVGTWMVSRNIANPAAAFAWGVLVAIGMGTMISPVIWVTALTNPGLLYSTLGLLILAIAMAGALVSWLPWDFSRLAPLLFVGLLLLVATSVLAWIVPSVMGGVVLSKTYALIGVLIFTGYLVVDLSLMRARNRVLPGDGAAVVLAVALLVDIINLFLFLLRLGRR